MERSKLAQAAIFQGVASRDVEALTETLQSAEFPAGHVFFAEGQSADELYVILSGKVKIGYRAPNGRQQLSTVRGPSDLFGELSLFDPGPRTSTATALTTVTAAPMDRTTMQRWLAARPEISERLLRMLARRLRRTDDHLSDLVFTDAVGRLAKLLLTLAQQFGVQHDGATRVTHDLTQTEIAQLVGTTRETVNKALMDFSQRGWIRLDGKSVLIIDSECLARRAH